MSSSGHACSWVELRLRQKHLRKAATLFFRKLCTTSLGKRAKVSTHSRDGQSANTLAERPRTWLKMSGQRSFMSVEKEKKERFAMNWEFIKKRV